MIKKDKVLTPKSKKAFSLTEFTFNKVKRLTLHFEDLPVDESKDSTTKVPTAIMSGTLYMFQDGEFGKKDAKTRTVNFMLPLQSNAEFKRHILSIIKSAMELDKASYTK